jgi:hypothetical protein
VIPCYNLRKECGDWLTSTNYLIGPGFIGTRIASREGWHPSAISRVG